ncbi:helix-turn-helix domain-containing protein [Bacillus pumilus]|uniref:helix-turn-helix domain-containing protein n=1 Tax=Bacillus pumilus TaxID=1408 RepID=UPI0011A2845D|nr:helix-turn-helix domain-containing protein [Bacillus pumilus]
MKFNINEVIDMLNNGKSIREVSNEIDVAYTTINNHLKRNGYSFDKDSRQWLKKESDDDDMAKTALTVDEVNFLRKMHEFYGEDVGKATLMAMFANMNHFHNKKRYTYVLSDSVHEDFKTFSDGVRNTINISHFELVELALSDFMKKFHTIL